MAIRSQTSANTVIYRDANLPAQNSITLMFWFNIQGTSLGNVLASHSGPGRDIYYDGSPGNLSLWNGSTSGTGSALSTGTWYHLAYTADASSSNLYLNGALDVTLGLGGTGASSVVQVGLFGSCPDMAFTAGKMWDVALTLAEIKAEMRQMMPYRFANLNTWTAWRDTGEQLVDYGPNSRNWVLTGTLSPFAGPPVPWQARRRNWVFIPTGGGGATFQAAWARGSNPGLIGAGVSVA